MIRNIEKIWWKKLGGGSARLRIGGRLKIIKPNERFQALPEEISESFRDVIIPLEDIPTASEEKISGKSPKYSLESTKRNGFYNIVDEQGKKINQKALNKADATQLIEDLEK